MRRQKLFIFSLVHFDNPQVTTTSDLKMTFEATLSALSNWTWLSIFAMNDLSKVLAMNFETESRTRIFKEVRDFLKVWEFEFTAISIKYWSSQNSKFSYVRGLDRMRTNINGISDRCDTSFNSFENLNQVNSIRKLSTSLQF